jgi:hypothetical protein
LSELCPRSPLDLRRLIIKMAWVYSYDDDCLRGWPISSCAEHKVPHQLKASPEAPWGRGFIRPPPQEPRTTRACLPIANCDGPADRQASSIARSLHAIAYFCLPTSCPMLYKGQTDIECPRAASRTCRSPWSISAAPMPSAGIALNTPTLFFAGAFSIRNGKFVRASAPDEFSIDHGGKP